MVISLRAIHLPGPTVTSGLRVGPASLMLDFKDTSTTLFVERKPYLALLAFL